MSPELVTTAFVASLLGSLHCVGMCGGFVAFYAGSDRRVSYGPHLAYNGGRLVSYVLLGAIAGTVGAAVNLAGAVSGLREVAAIVAGSLIIVGGLASLAQVSGRIRAPTPRWLSLVMTRMLKVLQSQPPTIRAFVLGASSTLLPCGWLYGFVITAAGTGSAMAGASLMAVFWLGTVPAMLSMGLGAQRLARWIGPRLGVIMPLMLVALGTWTLLHRNPLHAAPSQATSGSQVEHHDCH